MSNFDETLMKRLTKLEREVERLQVKESPGAWLDWTPTQTGWTALPTGQYRYCKVGKLVTILITMTAGTSNSTSAELSLPIASAATQDVYGVGTGADNGVDLSTPIMWAVWKGSTNLAFYKTAAWDSWTASGTKLVNVSFSYFAA